MRVYILLFLSLFCSHLLRAQQPVNRLATGNTLRPQPLVFVDSFMTTLDYLILDPIKIKSVTVLKDTSAVNRFGDMGRNGVVLIKTRDSIKLLRLPALLNNYSLPDSVKKLRVCINEVIVRKPQLVLVDPSEVMSINTFVMTHWENPRKSREEMFINITKKKKAAK